MQSIPQYKCRCTNILTFSNIWGGSTTASSGNEQLVFSCLLVHLGPKNGWEKDERDYILSLPRVFSNLRILAVVHLLKESAIEGPRIQGKASFCLMVTYKTVHTHGEAKIVKYMQGEVQQGSFHGRPGFEVFHFIETYQSSVPLHLLRIWVCWCYLYMESLLTLCYAPKKH